MLNVVILCVVMLSVVMLSVIIPSVVSPLGSTKFYSLVVTFFIGVKANCNKTLLRSNLICKLACLTHFIPVLMLNRNVGAYPRGNLLKSMISVLPATLDLHESAQETM
jgi:hypothetical protein